MMNKVLVPVDGSPLAERALPYAEKLVQAAGGTIVLLRVHGPHPRADDLGNDLVFSQSEHGLLVDTELENLAATVERTGVRVETISHPLSFEGVADAICMWADRSEVDAIVMSTHGRGGVGRFVYGSVADDVMRHAHVPVVLVAAACKAAWSGAPKRVLVPLDGSPFAEEALAVVDELAGPGVELVLLRVVPPLPPTIYADAVRYIPTEPDAELEVARAYVEPAAEKLRASGRTVRTLAHLGDPAEVIAREAEWADVDLIAMATHGRGGLARLVLGSVATGVLERAHTPLLLVRPGVLRVPRHESAAVATT